MLMNLGDYSNMEDNKIKKSGIKILYCFTSTHFEPFDRIRKEGVEKTWPQWIKSPSKVYALVAVPPWWARITKPLLESYEYYRWAKYGWLFIGIFQKLLLPISYLNPDSRILRTEIQTKIPESFLFMGFKHLAAMQFAYENEYEFLVMTNSSSFLNIRRIENYLTRIPKDGFFYAGKPLNHPNSHGASGSFYILNRVTIETILKNRSKWVHGALDDIALLKLMTKLNIGFTKLPSVDAKTNEFIDSLDRNSLQKIMHFKVGDGNTEIFRKDDLRMLNLWSKYYKI